jgi:hypothetical protein
MLLAKVSLKKENKKAKHATQVQTFESYHFALWAKYHIQLQYLYV